MPLRTSAVYKFTCDCCQQSYMARAILQMFRRYSGDQDLSFRTGSQIIHQES